MSTKLLKLTALLALFLWFPARADIPTYDMPKRDMKDAVQTVEEQLLFYDHGGATGNIQSVYYQTLCIFKSANEGDALSITFNSVDLNGPVLYIYDGEISAYNKVTEGYIGTVTGTETATFEAASGTMSVLYYSTGTANSGAGWEALIESVPSKDMEWVSAAANTAFSTNIYPGATAVPLMCVDILTDGGGNPLNLNNITFALEGAGMATFKNLRCVLNRDPNSPAGGDLFGETFDAAASSMTFSGAHALKSKHNYIWLVADIDVAASAGTSVSPVCSSLKVADAERLSTPLTGSAAEIKNMLFMPTGPVTYKIGDTPLLFYDDGGPEANITLNFQGEVTFEPEHDGKKVRIVFESLDLFNTSTIGKNDVLKIYNDRAADNTALLASLLNDPLTIHSTAADGSLTVTFQSLTGVNPKSGWVARVEEFTPQPMTVTALTATGLSGITTAAGTAAKALSFEATTVGTEPAATLNAVTLSLAGSTAPIASVSLTDPNGNLLGEADVTSEAVTMTLSAPLALGERDNIFNVNITPATAALSGQTIAAALQNVQLSSGSMIPSASTPAALEINNVCQLTRDYHEHTIFGEWTLTHEPHSNSYLGYDGTAGERKVTLHPGTEGMFIELEFNSFYVNWPTWGNAPTFKVYSGSEATGEPIWTMTQANAKTGPETPLRSSSVDGAMTILFNPNGNNGAMGQGFNAAVREYIPAPMQLSQVEVSQAGTDPVQSGDTNVAVLRIATTTTGDLNPLPFESLSIDLKDSKGSVKSAKLYSTGRSDQFTTGNLIASAEVPAEASSVTLIPTATTRLAEKTCYYWLAFDMNEQIEPGHDIDAAVTEMKVNGSAVSGIITPDPEGARPSVAVYLFDGDDRVVDVKGTLLFYDDGGATGKYTTTHKGKVTFRPAEGEIIRFSFKQFYTNISDYFYIYDGAAASGALRAKLSSSKTDLADIFSTSEDGCLSVDFNPTKNKINDGWYIEVSSVRPEPLHIATAEFTAIEDARLLRGAEKLLVARLRLEVEGNRGPVPFTEFNFDTAGTTAGLLAGLSLTGSGQLESYNDVNEIASAATGALSSPDFAISTPGTYYLWLRADIAADAPATGSLKVALTSVANADGTLWNTPGEQLELALTPGLNGTYTIGASQEADYATIQAAADALKQGVDGPVTFLIESGDYKELVTIPEIPGAGEAHPVTFRSASGNRADVTLHYDSYTASYGQPEYGVLTVKGADWLTLEALTLTSSANAFPMIVKLQDASRHFTMRDCHVYSPHRSGSSDPTLVECYVSSEAVPDRNNDYASFENCLFEGGYMGVQLGGTSIVNPVALPVEKGGSITDCTFIGQYSKGIYLSAESDARLLRNYFESQPNSYSSYYAMDLLNGYDDLLVEGNIINHAYPVSSSSGIYVRNLYGSAEKAPAIINNEIVISNATSAVRGITIQYPVPYLRLAHNSVSISGSAASSACLYVNDKMTEAVVANNIFDNRAAGYAVRVQKAEYMPAAFTTNMMRSSAEATLNYLAGDIADLEAWATASSDATAFSAEVEYLAADILEPMDFAPLAKGTPLAYVTTDISGTPRDATAPTIGAYEASAMSVTPSPAEGYPLIDCVTHESARLTLAANCHAAARVLVLEASAESPDIETVETSELTMNLRKNRPASLTLPGLDPNTEYKAWLVIKSLRGETGELVATPVFETTYAPTAVSTFENVQMIGDEANGPFLDGTARFDGFMVENEAELPVPGSTRIAAMEDTEATVTLTNASNLTLDGFWLRNTAEVELTALSEDYVELNSKTLPASGWRYVNLRDMGEMAALRFFTEGSAAIDDFSGQPAALSAELQGGDARVTQGETFSLTALAEGGVQPFTYSWSDKAGNQIGSGATLSRAAEVTNIYSVKVTDAWGAEATVSARLNVSGNMVIATFDDLYLEPDSKWHGDVNDPDYMSGTFLSGSFEFSNYYMADWNSWSWFGYANLEGTNYSSYNDDMVCAAGSGHDSAGYGVAFMGEYYGPTLMSMTNSDEAQTIPGLWLTNTEWVRRSVLEGDGMSDKFEQGDYCAVLISGEKEDGSYTEPLEIRLADFTSEDEADRYVLDTWQWFPLESLGAVKKLRWEFTSTKRNAYGVTTPTYVCIDDLGDMCPIEELAAVTISEDDRTVDLSEYFDFDPEDGNITYNLLSGDATVVEGKAVVTAGALESTTLVVRAAQRGRQQWISLPVDVTVSSVNRVNASDVTGYSVYNTQGILLHTGSEMPHLDSGIYIVVRHTASGSVSTVERR